jgi:preprotein translocase subunit SecE
VNAFFQELFHIGLYKRSQGRVTRQVTFAAVAVGLAAGLWRLSQSMIGWGPAVCFGGPGALLLAGLWAAYRLVNVPAFADFLIAVEAEMNKVSWPTRGELYRSSIVVLVTIFALAAVLFGFDFFWGTFFQWLRIL